MMAINVITVGMIHALNRGTLQGHKWRFTMLCGQELASWFRHPGEMRWRHSRGTNGSVIQQTGRRLTTDQVVAAVQAYKAAGWHPVETPAVLR